MRAGDTDVGLEDIGFESANLLNRLDLMADETLDHLKFGIIRFDKTDKVIFYNKTESQASLLPLTKVLGRNFFATVAPCMNNYMVATRFEIEPELDAVIDYVLTLRMPPTPVKMRLLASQSSPNRYVVIKWL